MARFFITGATGFVGSYIARELLELGHSVKALKRSNSQFNFVQDFVHRVEWCEGDVLDTMALQQFFENVDYVVHAAAIVSFAKKDRKKMYEYNIQGTANMLNVAKKFPIRKFIHISSVAALGRSKKLKIINEQTQWEDSDENTEYAITKFHSEMEVWRASEEGLPVLVVNPSVVLGRGDKSRSSLQILSFAEQKLPFYPIGSLNYVDVRDVAHITVRLALSDIINERFILDGGTVSFREFFTKIAKLNQFSPPTIAIRPWMSEIAWRVFAVASFLTGKESFFNKETARASMQNFIYDTSKIRSLGFRFRTLDETLEWIYKNEK
ncbi:MAG: NAD-dependent epimerase/dehydratase family protein [Cytophagales bacterium]|nr:NAD-dependent epimerase/dehydratase family protein [Cytophagales bacterium]MDW8383717.1 NAD-dependent epimerase/dehydratase family protein [Flammeovirgaceae bacterium]